MKYGEIWWRIFRIRQDGSIHHPRKWIMIITTKDNPHIINQRLSNTAQMGNSSRSWTWPLMQHEYGYNMNMDTTIIPKAFFEPLPSNNRTPRNQHAWDEHWRDFYGSNSRAIPKIGCFFKTQIFHQQKVSTHTGFWTKFTNGKLWSTNK